MRLDKWLYYARFFKTRSLAGSVISRGHLRLNSVKTRKVSTVVTSGDVLTFSQERQIRVIKVMGMADRRGPFEQARKLYLDLEETSA